MADILTQEEKDALLSATTDEGTAKEEPSGPRITSYDFKHPARVNKDQLRTLENLHDNFARLLSCTFSGAMRAVVDVDTAFVDQTTYAEYIMSLSNPSCSYQFTLGPTNGQAILDFSMPLVFSFVDRVFGGKGSSQGVDARQMSQVEMGVLAKIVKRVVEDLEATWEPILRVEISDIELETNPEFMQITAASEIVILLAFEVNSTNAKGLVSLCYPFFTLESILPRLGQQTYVRQRGVNLEELIHKNKERLRKTLVPVRAELGRGQLSVGEARRAQVGDVLKLDKQTDEPVVLFVEEQPKFLGLPFTGPHGKTTVKIIEAIDPSDEELHVNRSRPVPILGDR
ncbi:flagellar motor switch protein FliM [Candidatus Latescibacterota bacterium]